MPRKKVFDAKKLVKMVRDETHQKEIMKTFGLKTPAQVKAAYYRALVESGEVPGIKGGRAAGKSNAGKVVRVGKRGSIIIPKELVAEMGLGAKEKLSVRRTRAGIALKKV